MQKTILTFLNPASPFVLAAALILTVDAVAAEPIATLPLYNHVGEQLMASGGRTREDVARDIPTTDELTLPVYPEVFYSGTIRADGMLPTVVLASGAPLETVEAWYREQQDLRYDETGRVFYRGDAYVMGSTESVFLQDISADPAASVGGMVFDMHGMKTQITVSYQPREGSEHE